MKISLWGRLVPAVVLACLAWSAPAVAGNWTQMTSPTTSTLHSIWGKSENDVYAVGENGTVVHFDGAGWSFMPGLTDNITLHGVWADQANVFVVGDNGTALRNVNGTWSNTTTSANTTLTGVWGVPEPGPYDVFAVGWNGTVLRHDGANWSPMQSNTFVSLADVWGSNSTNVFAAGNATTPSVNPPIIHYAGNASGWANETLLPPTLDTMLRGVWGNPGAPVGNLGTYFAVGDFWNGTGYGALLSTNGSGQGWSMQYLPSGAPPLNSIWGHANSSLWIAGDNGAMIQYNGTGWNSATLGNFTLNDIWGVNGTSSFQVFTVGDNGTIWRYVDGAPIISAFTASPNTGTSPLPVYFTCTATDDGQIVEYRWDIDGNGVVDFVTGPANSTLNYTYGASGIYNATCTVVDDSLLYATATQTVTVNAPANATSNPPTLVSFVANPESGTPPLAVLFTFTATDDNGTVTYRLDVNNDGSPEYWTNSTNFFSWTYNATGSYTANGTVYDAQNQTASAIRHITVTSGSAPTISSLSATPLTGELPLEVTFTVSAADANGDLSLYDFDFNGDGTYDRTVNATLTSSTTYKYATAGTYSARARARDRAGNQAVSSAVSITVRPAKVAGASNQSAAVASVTVNTQDNFPMSSSSLINNYRISENNFTSLSDVREFTSAVAPATGVPATYCYKFSGVSQNIAELRLYKLTGSTNIPFRYAAAPSPDTDGAWWVATEAGSYLSQAQSITASNIYQACFVIRDNGPYDLDTALGSIRDPQVLGAVPAGGGGGIFGGGGGGGGGGGCTLAPAAPPALDLALLLVPAAIALIRRRRR